MVKNLLGYKKGMSQVWTESGRRWPVTKLVMSGNVVIRQIDYPNNENRIQLAFGDKKMKNVPAPTQAQLKKAGLKVGKRFFAETQMQIQADQNSEDQSNSKNLQPGTKIRVEDVFSPGDFVKVTGRTKGRGFTGVVKRWGFAGGPRTHGQSDRLRAPGSIGAGTTPGRVWKGKKMAGHSGNAQQTLEVCQIVAIDPQTQSLWIKGTIPGAYNSMISLQKQDPAKIDPKIVKKAGKISQESFDLLGIQPAKSAQETKDDQPTQDNQESKEK